MEPKVHGSLLQLQEPPTLVPLLSHTNPVHNLRSNVILFSNLWPGLPSGLCPSAVPTKPTMHLSSYPTMPHAPPISFFLISSPRKHLMISTNHEAPHYAIFSSLLLLPMPKYIPQQTILKLPQLIIIPSCQYLQYIITGGSCSLFYGITQHVPGGTEKNHEKFSHCYLWATLNARYVAKIKIRKLNTPDPAWQQAAVIPPRWTHRLHPAPQWVHCLLSRSPCLWDYCCSTKEHNIWSLFYLTITKCQSMSAPLLH